MQTYVGIVEWELQMDDCKVEEVLVFVENSGGLGSES